MTHFTYYDTRFGETFTIWMDGKTCIGIERHLGGVSTDPMRYDDVSQLPLPHRHHIEEEIKNYNKAHK